MNKAAFLDRDGVINRRAPEGDYITRLEDLHFLPGVAEAIGLLKQAGFRVIVVSNQRCVAKGLLSAGELESMHARMCSLLARQGAEIDAVYYCPHELEPQCRCRKPQPGMLLDAARDHSIQMSASWMIGDSKIDIEAGRSAGCRTARVLDPEKVTRNGGRAADDADLTVTSLLEAAQAILAGGDASRPASEAETLQGER